MVYSICFSFSVAKILQSPVMLMPLGGITTSLHIHVVVVHTLGFLSHSCTHTSGQWLQRQVPCIYNHTILSSYFVLPHKCVEDLASTQHCHTDGTRQLLNVLIYMIPPQWNRKHGLVQGSAEATMCWIYPSCNYPIWSWANAGCHSNIVHTQNTPLGGKDIVQDATNSWRFGLFMVT